MNKCINCGKDFVNPETLTCKFCGTKNPERGKQKTNDAKKELGIEDKEREPINKVEDSIHPDEKTLNSVANFILAVGVISFIVLIPTVVFVESSSRYSNSLEFNSAGFGTAVATLLTSIATYSIMKVIRLISINTRKTKEYLEEMCNNKEKE